ncbi:MAG: imelysin family protein [Anaerolineae bacterium]|nr:imelysin family protein [Anaerolineae bacterium]
MPFFRSLLLALVAGLLLAAPVVAQDEQTETFTQGAMLENIGNQIIMPLHTAFYQRVANLHNLAQAFTDDPTQEHLAALQQQWRTTVLLWEQVKIFRLGRAFVTHARIANETPPNVDFIESLIAEPRIIDADFIGTFGSNMIGLHTLEYLLFNSGAPENVLARYTEGDAGAQRRRYLLIVTDILEQDTSALLEMWSPDGQNYLRTFIVSDNPTSVRQSTSMLANEMIFSLEQVVQMSLHEPLGMGTGIVRPVAVPAPYSGFSMPMIQGFFEAFRATFNGNIEGQTGLGFDDYLNSLDVMYNGVPMADEINREIDDILVAIEAVQQPMEIVLNETPDKITTIYEEARDLVLLMKIDMMTNLGLTITFTDSDGD